MNINFLAVLVAAVVPMAPMFVKLYNFTIYGEKE
jgi:hypothetical protein